MRQYKLFRETRRGGKRKRAALPDGGVTVDESSIPSKDALVVVSMHKRKNVRPCIELECWVLPACLGV